jgi:hypothetical protein
MTDQDPEHKGPVKHLLDNLLSLEVNTLVKAGMTGRKMPPVGQALLDIFDDYDSWLCDRIGALNRAWRVVPPERVRAYVGELRRQDASGTIVIEGYIGTELAVPPSNGQQLITAKEFQDLGESAAIALEFHRLMSSVGGDRPALTMVPGDAILLRRIMRNCDQLVTILQRPELTSSGTPLKLTRGTATGIENEEAAMKFAAVDVVTIRKAWELGTEVIVMQTVAQVDGDVVTRLNQAFMAPEQQPLRDVHSQGVNTALAQWNSLVQTVLSILGKLSDFVSPT